MAPYSQLSARQLRAKLALVEKALEEACPKLVAEKRLLESLIAAAETPESEEFSKVKGYAAITGALTKSGNWLTHAQIVDLLVKGGYPKTDRKGSDTLRDLINRYTSKDYTGPKRLLKRGDRVGLPEWPEPSDTSFNT